MSLVRSGHRGPRSEDLSAAIDEQETGGNALISFVRPGDAVLHLGCGDGKTCRILAQIAGPGGKVFGVDPSREAIALARDGAEDFADKAGFDSLRFGRANSDDLQTDLGKLDRMLAQAAIDSLDKLLAFEARKREIFTANPLVADRSIDIVIADLQADDDLAAIFAELSRVLKPRGRIALAIALPPDDLAREQELYATLEAAGFEGLRIESRDGDPIRSVTVTAVKPAQAAAAEERSPAGILYRGPWLEVVHEDGLRLRRGVVTAVPGLLAAALLDAPYGCDAALVSGFFPVAEEPCCAPASRSGGGCC